MRWLNAFFLTALFAVVLAGCKSDSSTAASGGSDKSSTASTPAPSTDADLVGSWTGEMKLPEASKDDPAAAMAKGMGDMFAAMISLEIEKDRKFTMSFMMFPIEGSYTREGDLLTLTPEKVMGMTPEEFKKMQEAQGKPTTSSEDATKPMKLHVSKGGEELIMDPEPGKEKEGAMVFKRGKAPSKEEGSKNVASTVSTDIEKSLVGTFKADLRVDESKLTEKEKSELPMAKAMLGSAKVELLADKTFMMTMMFKLKGIWSVEGNMLKLDIKEMVGMPGGKSSSENEPMMLEIQEGGKVLHAVKSEKEIKKDGGPSAMDNAFYFVKQ